jgi:TonB family protein
VKILVRALQIGRKGATVIDSGTATMAVSDESAKLMQTYIASPESNPDVDKSFPVAGKGGYSFPGCVHCPQPQYSRAALDAKLQGTVTIIAVVSADGRAINIKTVKPLAYGLTDNAIEAIEQWRFEPAKDPDGRPIAVRQIIEVTFHLY